MNQRDMLYSLWLRLGYGIAVSAISIIVVVLLHKLPMDFPLSPWIQLVIFLIYLFLLGQFTYKITGSKIEKEEKETQRRIDEVVQQERERSSQEVKRIERECQETLKLKLAEIQEKKVKELVENYALFQKGFDDLSNILRERLYFTSKLNDAIDAVFNKAESLKQVNQQVRNLFYSEEFDETKVKCQQINDLLSVLCDDLRADAYHRLCMEKTLDVHLHFKATILEPIVETAGEGVLRRHPDLYKYPPGLDPQTTEIEEIESPKATAIQCWRNQQIMCVDDIPREALKHAEHKKDVDEKRYNCRCLWEDLRENQHQDYGSMICAYIARGKPKSPQRKVKAILSIDTPEKGYFQTDQLSKTFWADFIAPFRIYMALLYELEALQKNMVRVMETCDKNQK